MPKHQVINPQNGELLYEYPYTTAEEVDSALQQLTEQNRDYSPIERCEVLLKLKTLILEEREQFAELISKETGKSLILSNAEVDRALVTLTVAAEESKRIQGVAQEYHQHTVRENLKYSLTQRFPLGVVMCITPFNFPLNLALHKIAPAFAMGNRILFKPSECNFKTAQLFLACARQAGMDVDTLQMIVPTVETLNSLIQDKRIDVISFTGGTATADKIAHLAGRKKLLFELGGNDALIIEPDADRELLKKHLLARFIHNGQACTSPKRYFVHKSIVAEIEALIVKLHHGARYEQAPLISEKAAQDVQQTVQAALDAGAQLVFGHERTGAFYSPTFVKNIPPEAQLIQEETFGPVISLITYENESDLVEQVNQSRYGLQAGVFTNDLQLVKRLYQRLEVGSIAVNLTSGFRQENLPFGGVKDSGNGREGISFAMEEMSYIKQLVF